MRGSSEHPPGLPLPCQELSGDGDNHEPSSALRPWAPKDPKSSLWGTGGRRLAGCPGCAAGLFPAPSPPCHCPTPGLSTRSAGSSFSGSRPAGPRQGEDIMVNGRAQSLTHVSLNVSKPRTRAPGSPGLQVVPGNSGLLCSSSRKRTHVPVVGQALAAPCLRSRRPWCKRRTAR